MRTLLLLALFATVSCSEQEIAVTEAPSRTENYKDAKAEEAELPPAEPRSIEREDGIAIEVLEAGKGHPLQVGERVRAHVIARVQDAEDPFLSTRTTGRPLTYSVDVGRTDTPIEGLRRALTELRVGSRAKVTIPSDLAYGTEGLPAAGIPADAILEFEIGIKSRIQP